jgi:hypothetical protein
VTGRLDWRPGERWSASFAVTWERREDAVSGVGLNQVLTPARAVVFDPATGASFVSIGQAAGIRAFEVDDTITSDRWLVQLSARYRVSRRTTIFSRITWFEVENQQSAGVSSASRFTFQVGVRYVFDPIPLPI